ncbi:TonB-dependent receptor [Sphingomonas sp. BT553]|uniref:TonB-dependent receptor n=2 Tax=Sphingomonas mollis TaxID=2795726 RepID=A0ABS0XN85_9SPHN|nr:TonB-dependent receptor [Sphingomonas sp. BT553]
MRRDTEMTHQRTGRWALAACRCPLWIAVALCSPVAAQRAPPSATVMSIPAGRLDSALRRLAVATGRQVLFDPAVVGARRTRGVRGPVDRDRALRRMLAGSGLAARTLPGGVVIIVAAAPAPKTAWPLPMSVEDEIVVTALKRPTPLVDTEMSIATVSAAEIDARGTYDLRSVARQLPGLVAFNTGPLQQRLAIRGVSGTGEATVGVYFGETPINGPSGTTGDPGAFAPDIDLVDIERIELLKGPQGTLYGASSMGGTLRILPQPVDLARASASVESRVDAVDGGGWGGSIAAVANVPLVDDRLAVRIVAHRRSLGGYIDNDRLGIADTGGLVREGARLRVAWAPVGDVRVEGLYLHQHTRIDDGGAWDPALGRYRDVPATRTPNTDRIDLTSATVHAGIAGMTLTATGSHVRWSLIRQLDYTNVLARQRDSMAGCLRLAGLPVGARCSADQMAVFRAYVDARLPSILYQPTRMRSSNAEVRLASPAGAALTWTIGAFMEHRRDAVASYAAGADAATGLLIQPLDVIGLRTIATGIDQQAVFAEGTYEVVPRLSATLGARHYRYQRRAAGAVPIPNIITGTAGLAEQSYAGRARGSNLKSELAYRVPDGPLFYALISEGYRPGGINVTPNLTDAERFYDADHLWNYEFGMKAARRGWSVEGAVYRIEWRNTIFAASSPNGAFNYNANLTNVGITGAELRSTVTAGPLRLIAAASLSDARLGADTVLGTSEGMGRKGDRLPNVPRIAYLLSAEATLPPPAPGDRLIAGIDVSGNDASPTGFNAGNPYFAHTASRTEVALRAGYEHGSWQVDLNIDNALNAVAPVRLFSSAFGERQLYSARPRTISLRSTVRL